MTPTPQPNTAVEAPTVENVRDTLGIGWREPRLSWITRTTADGWRQGVYELELVNSAGKRLSSVARESDESVLVSWPFAALESRERVGVRVRVAARSADRAHPAWSAWSDVTWVETGLLDESDWTARFVSPDWDEDASKDNPCAVLRRPFALDGPVRTARLYATALGVYEAELNGARIGDQVLAPGWTAYDQRLRYQTYDVTELLHEGANEFTATLADGWYRGRLGWEGGRALYGERLALLAQLEIVMADGRVFAVATDADGTWQAAPGPTLRASLYDGETHDARIRPENWHGVRAEAFDMAVLAAPTGPPVRRTEELSPVAVTTSPSGKTVMDFGQNLVGRLRLTVDGAAGREIVLRHAEVLQDGELAVEPLRTAEATDRYILRGGAPETWEPRFTFHGFRYVEVTGWPGEFDPDAVRAAVIHSDMERVGFFESSDELVNRLHENAVWGMRGNFLDVPTDCPQRDERLGWTGDIQVFSPTACQLYDSAGFLGSWLVDLALEQRADGAAPSIVPKVTPFADLAAAGWSDAATVVPWTLYQRYGDKGVLAAQFASMRAWVDHVAELAGPDRLWNTGFQFGDWLDPSAPAGQPQAAKTPAEVVATAYFAHSASLVAQAAAVLGLEDEERQYSQLAADVRTAFQHEYVTSKGRIIGDAQTAYSLALQFALLPGAEQRRHAADRLAALVRNNGHRIGTGFLGTPLICDALAENGHLETAYRLLLERGCPSWLYPVTQGATTIWERWDSMRPDGTVNRDGMTSFNHYALGAVVDWLYRTVAGLDCAEPGYRRLRIAPRPGGGLTYAKAVLRTPYGPASVAWRINGDELVVEADVPPNTTASVDLLGAGSLPDVGAGHHAWTIPAPKVATARFTLDSWVSELRGDQRALEIFKDAMLRYWPEVAEHLETPEADAGMDLTLRQLGDLAPRGQELLAELEHRFLGYADDNA
ncbi:family 78 glycoside hydrolase catalytic domain [Streptodolium elevatio]